MVDKSLHFAHRSIASIVPHRHWECRRKLSCRTESAQTLFQVVTRDPRCALVLFTAGGGGEEMWSSHPVLCSLVGRELVVSGDDEGFAAESWLGGQVDDRPEVGIARAR